MSRYHVPSKPPAMKGLLSRGQCHPEPSGPSGEHPLVVAVERDVRQVPVGGTVGQEVHVLCGQASGGDDEGVAPLRTKLMKKTAGSQETVDLGSGGISEWGKKLPQKYLQIHQILLKPTSPTPCSWARTDSGDQAQKGHFQRGVKIMKTGEQQIGGQRHGGGRSTNRSLGLKHPARGRSTFFRNNCILPWVQIYLVTLRSPRNVVPATNLGSIWGVITASNPTQKNVSVNNGGLRKQPTEKKPVCEVLHDGFLRGIPRRVSCPQAPSAPLAHRRHSINNTPSTQVIPPRI